MKHIGLAVRGSQRIEAFLKGHFGAEGKGLHEILTSVEKQIPEKTVKRTRYVASVRNKVVHEEADIDDLDAFSACVESVLEDLQTILDEREAARRAEEEARAEQERLRSGGVRVGRGDAFDDRDPAVVITRMPLWAKVAIPVLAFAALWSYLSLLDKNEKIDRLYERVNVAESRVLQNNLDMDARARSQKTAASHEATILSLRKQLKEAQEQANKSQGTLKTQTTVSRTPPNATISSPTSMTLQDAQSKLSALGYYAGVPDGLAGPGTRRALTSFQQQNGLSQTGKLDVATNAALFSTHAKAAESPVTNGGRSVNLLAAAQKTQNDSQRGYAAIDEGIRGILSRSSVKIGKVDVLSGNVQVEVGWSTDVSAINELLKEHLKLEGSKLHIEINRYGQDKYRSYSPSLLSSLRKKTAYLVVKVGPKTGRIKIGGDARCFVSCRFSSSKLNAFYLEGSQSTGGKYPKVVNVKGLSTTEIAAVDQVTGWIEWN